MGGNGQFNRLSALDGIADEEGPWRDKLTEDQDLGLRLIAQGWEGRQDLRAYVSQQGLSKVLPLIRQRTRWSQGNLQAIALWPQVLGAPFGWGARLEQMAFIFLPFWQGIMFCGMVSAVLLAVLGVASFWGGGPTWELVFFYLMAFGGTSMGCVAAKSGQGPAGWAKGFLTGQVYTFYTWLLWPVLLRSTARQLARRDSWAKTARESLDAEPAQSPVATQTQSIANG
jgi:cellulose synthase/poly-beta-1,6-N-acetylglucosamine synthase-like glycosyltransferase